MKPNIIKLSICFLLISIATSCGNSKKDEKSDSAESESLKSKKEVAPSITKTPEDYGMEMADAKCKKETAKNEGNPMDAKKWDEKLESLKSECDSKYPDNAEAAAKISDTYEYWTRKCPAMKVDEEGYNGSDSGG
jgi:hypothetical protein